MLISRDGWLNPVMHPARQFILHIGSYMEMEGIYAATLSQSVMAKCGTFLSVQWYNVLEMDHRCQGSCPVNSSVKYNSKECTNGTKCIHLRFFM